MLSSKQLRASFRRVGEEDDIVGRPKGRPRWEYAVIIPLVAIAFFSTAALARQQIEHYRRIRLHQEVWQIRNAILMYHVLHRELPPDLATLTTTIATPEGGIAFPLLEHVRVDGAGEVIDPLGYPYSYNPATGRVASIAPGCQYW